MIEHFLDSTLVIDDQLSEAEPLMAELSKQDIWITYKNPDELLETKAPLRTRKLIFLDLYLVEGASLETNVSTIRAIFSNVVGQEFGCYGLILWSKHVEELDVFREKIIKDTGRYCLPLFILGLDKTRYLKDGYGNLVKDIDDLLIQNVASSFFVYWNKLVDSGKSHSIQSIYSLASQSYNTLESDLQFLLFQLAKNHTGIPVNKNGAYKLEDDAIKAIADMLHYDIIHQHNLPLNLFTPGKEDYAFSGDVSRVFASLNSKLFLDLKGMDQGVVIPGNVYQILEDNNLYALKGLPAGAIKIIVDITPPCDFSGGRKAELSRVLGGFYIQTLSGEATKKYGGEVFYSFLKGLTIPNYAEPQQFRFDYRFSGSIAENDLKNPTKYKLLFRFKDKLFADILQKFSAHTSRLGIPFIK